MDAAADRRRRMPVRVHHSFEAHERDDARYWAAIPPFIGRDAFIRTKRATGRIRDLGDIESLLTDPLRPDTSGAILPNCEEGAR